MATTTLTTDEFAAYLTAQPSYEPRYTREARDHLYDQLTYLLSRCDGAVADDGAGFSAFDAPKARRFHRRRPYWSDTDCDDLTRMLQKYRGQLSMRRATVNHPSIKPDPIDVPATYNPLSGTALI